MSIEIMAPAGSYESLMAAIKAGAGSVYFGVGNLNMRSRSANFQFDDLKKVAAICKKHKVNSYLTLNTVMYDEDIKSIKKICDIAKKAGITAVIASDISVINYCNKINLEVHMSTQVNISNIEAVKFYSKFADVIVLARELNLEQIKNIVSEIKKQKIKGPKGKLIQIEIFIHGALCVSISGKCYMSLAQYNKSANRGACLQACRRSYKVIDDETGDELKIDNQFVMSPKDLCTISVLDKILKSGVTVLKIEGRGRSPDYVYKTTKAYKEAIESIENKTYTKKKIDNWLKELGSVYNRGFWHGGYYLGNKLGEWCDRYGSKATEKKTFLGICNNYYTKKSIAEFTLQAGGIKKGSKIIITGPTTGVIETKLEDFFVDEKPTTQAKKGDIITFKLNEKTRMNDKLFVVAPIK
ncbi:MAG: U32 family peptidase [bacterium]|nr:U32 family peptidase [bacterium]